MPVSVAKYIEETEVNNTEKVAAQKTEQPDFSDSTIDSVIEQLSKSSSLEDQLLREDLHEQGSTIYDAKKLRREAVKEKKRLDILEETLDVTKKNERLREGRTLGQKKWLLPALALGATGLYLWPKNKYQEPTDTLQAQSYMR